MRSRFLRPAQCLLCHLRIKGLLLERTLSNTLSNKENIMIIIWSEETLKHILGGGLVELYGISELKSIE